MSKKRLIIKIISQTLLSATERNFRIMDRNVDVSALFTPPLTVKGMKTMDKTAFRKVIQLPALRIEAKTCSLFLKNLSKSLLNQPRTRNIVPDQEVNRIVDRKNKRVLLLHPSKSLATLSSQERGFAEDHKAEELVYDLELTYESWSAEQVLRALLPDDVTEVPSSFETIGHIAHLNLRDCQIDFKEIIGEAHYGIMSRSTQIYNRSNLPLGDRDGSH